MSLFDYHSFYVIFFFQWVWRNTSIIERITAKSSVISEKVQIRQCLVIIMLSIHAIIIL